MEQPMTNTTCTYTNGGTALLEVTLQSLKQTVFFISQTQKRVNPVEISNM